jgi:hypothetical protein
MPDIRRRPGRGGARRRNPRPWRAAVLLLLIAGGLVCVLVLLPPRQTPRQTTRQEVRPPEPASEPAPRPGGEGSEAPATETAAELNTAAREEPGSASTASARREAAERPVRVGRVAVVIDDVGYSLDNLEPFLATKLDLSLSVLPGLPHSREAARRIRDAGKEVLLHLPMQAQNGSNPGPVAVLTQMSDEEIRRLLDAALDEVPATGANNHMGSLATADERIMRVVLEHLEGRGLFFLDSRTTPESVALRVAREVGALALKRDVFLDNDPAIEAMRGQLFEALALAEQRGQAVLIGHVQNPQIVGLLEAALPELERRGLELVRAGELAGARSARSARSGPGGQR